MTRIKLSNSFSDIFFNKFGEEAIIKVNTIKRDLRIVYLLDGRFVTAVYLEDENMVKLKKAETSLPR